MQDLYINERTCRDEAGNLYTFQYSLLTDELTLQGVTYTDYGIVIRAGTDEPVCVPHVTTDYTRITELLSLLYENNVSPTHLYDVIENWL